MLNGEKEERQSGILFHYFLCSLFYWQYGPLIVLSILILILIEAAGNGQNYQKLSSDKVDRAQLTSAKIMQRTGILIMPMVSIFSSNIIAFFSESPTFTNELYCQPYISESAILWHGA